MAASDYASAVRAGTMAAARLHGQLDLRKDIGLRGGNVDVFGAVHAIDLPLLPARNQGPRPTCLAFAASDAHAALRPGWVPLSCEYAFYQAQRRATRPPSTGALLSAMLTGLRDDGQPEENGWPYLAATSLDAASWLPPTEVGPLFGRNGEKSSPMTDRVIAELDQGRPVIILIVLSRSFYAPPTQG
jgi:hypothetical protein